MTRLGAVANRIRLDEHHLLGHGSDELIVDSFQIRGVGAQHGVIADCIDESRQPTRKPGDFLNRTGREYVFDIASADRNTMAHVAFG